MASKEIVHAANRDRLFLGGEDCIAEDPEPVESSIKKEGALARLTGSLLKRWLPPGLWRILLWFWTYLI